MKLAIAGAGGRMGRTLIEAILGSGEFELSGALEAAGSPILGRDAGEAVGRPCGVRVVSDPAAAVAGADCLVDFTRPEGTLACLEECVKSGVRMVIGTTGLSASQHGRIVAAAKTIAIVLAPNMAVGVNVAFKLAETAARALGDSYDVEIVEAHHRRKIDAPSGTALRFGELIARALGRDLSKSAVHGRRGEVGERDPKAIGFHAIRGGDIVGEHTVMFAGEGERVEITVRSASRSTYALGALRAARFLGKKDRGLFDMQDVLGLSQKRPKKGSEGP
jgi:4-hydroxy-tetrahydrodipicolinate reductase